MVPSLSPDPERFASVELVKMIIAESHVGAAEVSGTFRRMDRMSILGPESGLWFSGVPCRNVSEWITSPRMAARAG